MCSSSHFTSLSYATQQINPNIDLDNVLFFVHSLNDSRISSLSIFAATGEQVKNVERISETKYSAKVFNLKKNKKTVIKVSYMIEDTQSYVIDQIDLFDSANLSSDAKNLVDQAKINVLTGDYNTALEYLEKATALAKQEEKDLQKLQIKYTDLNKKLQNELININTSLSKINPNSANSTFIDKLVSRQEELERVSEESDQSNISEKIKILESVDDKWLEKELKSFKKDISKEYNDLKERFYNAGNSTTPQEFLEFEAALNRLETGDRLEYAIDAFEAINKVEKIIGLQEENKELQKQDLRSVFLMIKSNVDITLDHYSKELAAAKGTEYSSMFKETEKNVQNLLKTAETSIDSDSRVFDINIQNLNKSQIRMHAILDTLEKEANAKFSLIETAMSQTDLDDNTRKDLESKVSIMQNMLGAREYVNALRAGSAIIEELDSYEKPFDNTLVLAVTAFAVLGAAGFYVYKQKEETNSKKQMRKLEKNESM